MLEIIGAYFDLEKRPFTAAILRFALFFLALFIVLVSLFDIWNPAQIRNTVLVSSAILLLSIALVTDHFQKFSYRIIPAAILCISSIFFGINSVGGYDPAKAIYFLLFFSPAIFFPLFAIAMAFLIRIHRRVIIDIALKAPVIFMISFLIFALISSLD